MDVKIIRTEVFVVGHSDQDEYGNLNVVCQEGNTYRINKKHEFLHPIFVDGTAVEVGYGNFMDKEFIHTARQVKDAIGEVKTADEVLFKPDSTETKTAKFNDKYKADPDKIKSIERQTSLKSAVEWCVAQNLLSKELKVTDVIAAASLFESYLENGVTIKKNEL